MLRIGPFVDDPQDLAVTFVDGAWLGPEHGRFETIQPDVAEVALVDAQRDDRPAIASRGQGIELTGASPVAVAGGELRSLYHPVDVGHGISPIELA